MANKYFTMQQDYIFFRLHMLTQFLKEVQHHREKLLNELIDRATDPVIRMRRFRMLSQLSQYESQIINKIANVETDDVGDFINHWLSFEISRIVNRDA